MSDYYSDLDRAMAAQSTYGNPHMPNQYSQAPVYSPFQNRHNINDSFSYLANMYGPGLVQGFAGPDAFLAHQMPGQARADQHEAAKYQRAVAQAQHNATARGNDAVARKLVGFQSGVMNGGLPPTQLDWEHAQVGATVFNNPMFKGFAAANMPGGHEALEGLMFGRRGDPAALAAATGQIGFYRRDAMGGKRMSAEGMEMFSTQLYNNLYGENADVDEMRGFGAHATGEMMQSLFQQGRLPRSIGSLTPSQRVKALSGSKRDEQTMQAMAEDYAHHDLLQRDHDYANATAEERKTMLGGKVGDYRKKLDTVFQEADKFRNNDPRAKSAAEIEQLGGFSMAANAVDAQRTGKVVKEYTGAVAAIRELFGDNGKSNAPIQELMDSLNHLAGGAQTSMSPAKLESTVRQIRMAARDSGVSSEQLMHEATIAQHRGAMLGLEPENVLRGMAGKLNYADAMQEEGVFNKAGWGKLDRATAGRRQAELSDRGDASHAGRALATINRLASENKEQFKGTELEAAAEAYRKGEDTYTYKGKTVNLKQIAGMEGVAGIMGVAQRSGAERNQIDAAFNDRAGTNEYLKEGYAFGAQKYQLQQRIGQQNKQTIMGRANTDEFVKKFKPAGMSDSDFRKKTNVIATGFSNSLSDIVMNETADMSADERAAHMEKRSKEELTAYLQTPGGGGLSASAAKKQADEYFNAFYGDTAEKRKAGMNTAYAEMNAISQSRTGMQLSAHQQIRKSSVEQKATATTEVNARREERIRAMSKGNETTISQRLGEELDRLSSGNSGTAKEAAARVANIFSEDDMLRKYAPEAQDALVFAGQMHGQSTITEEKFKKIAEAAAANPNGPEQKKLMEMAGYKAGQKLSDEEKASLVDKARMRSVGTAEGNTDAERAANTARQHRSNILFKAYNTGEKEDVQAGAVALAQEMLGDKAGKADVQSFADAALKDDQRDLERRISRMPKAQQAAARSVAAFLRTSQKIGGLQGPGFEQSAQSVAEAADRPTAKAHAFKRQISGGIKDRLDKEGATSAYGKLSKATFGNDAETARVKGAAVIDKLSKVLSDVTVDEMGGTENADPKMRAEYMEKRAREELKKHFVETEKVSPERAEEMAQQHFHALMGKTPEERQKALDTVYTNTHAEAKRQGLDAESVAQKRAAEVEAERAANAASDARIPNGAGSKKYDYKKLGVAEKVTPEQQKLIDQIKLTPTAAYFNKLATDKDAQQHLLTLPDAAAVDLFKQFSPEDQRAGLAKLQQAASMPTLISGLTQQQQQNADRLHTAITDSQGRGAGMSSNNVMTPAEYAQSQAAVRATAQGGNTYLPGAVQPATETAAIQERLADLHNKKAAALKSQDHGTVLRAVEEEKKLTQRQNELQSGDPLGFVQQEMSEIEGRQTNGWLWGKNFASGEDRSRYSELQARQKEIMSGGGAVVQQNELRGGAGAAQARGAESMTVSGVLTLNGLQEAILAANGQRTEETPSGGAPIAVGAPTGR